MEKYVAYKTIYYDTSMPKNFTIKFEIDIEKYELRKRIFELNQKLKKRGWQ